MGAREAGLRPSPEYRLRWRRGPPATLLPVDVLEGAVLEQPLAVLLDAHVVIDAAIALGDAVLVVDFAGVADDRRAVAVDLDRSGQASNMMPG